MNTICMHTYTYMSGREKTEEETQNDVLNCRTSRKKDANDNKRKEMFVSLANDSHDDDTIDHL